MRIRKIISVLFCAILIVSLTACGEQETNINSGTDTSVSSTVSEGKTVSEISEEPVETVEWSSIQVLAELPMLCETVDFYLDDTMGATTGSYEIKVKDIDYDTVKSFISQLLNESGFKVWESVEGWNLPDEMQEGQTAFCPLTNDADFWGIIEYNPNSTEYKFNMTFYNANPYSGY